MWLLSLCASAPSDVVGIMLRWMNGEWAVYKRQTWIGFYQQCRFLLSVGVSEEFCFRESVVNTADEREDTLDILDNMNRLFMDQSNRNSATYGYGCGIRTWLLNLNN